MRTLLLASVALLALSTVAAKADQVTYSSSGVFNTVNCIGCTGSGTATYGLSGLNPSSLTAVAGSGNFAVPPNTNDSVLGSIKWVNNASTFTDSDFNVNYKFSINFTAPTGNGASPTFAFNIIQTTNPLGDLVLGGFNNLLDIGAIEGINLGANVALTDVHWELADNSLGTFDGSHWYNSEFKTSTLNLVGDFINTNPNIGAVPEASTWAMMILGFLGVGGLSMRKKFGAVRLA